MCLLIVTARVITAQSIITNVNKSAYVTIGTSSFQNIQQPTYHPFGSPDKHIILSMYKVLELLKTSRFPTAGSKVTFTDFWMTYLVVRASSLFRLSVPVILVEIILLYYIYIVVFLIALERV